jgi:glycosyltransferase involved in cell wall biosynthesis
MTQPVTLTIVVPCFNEEAVLPATVEALTGFITEMVDRGKAAANSAVLFVDDGSTDKTWSMIAETAASNQQVSGIRFSCNRGHQNALLAGLFAASGDVVVSIDADLQDDVQAIEAMLDAYASGDDVVYGVRRQRPTDTPFKRLTAARFYGLMRRLGANTISDHADFRLMSRRAVEALKSYREVNLFLRGIVPLIGFRSSIVYYDRRARMAGESKYPFRKMLEFAIDAITSFSSVPLRLITLTGFSVFLITLALLGWVLWTALLTSNAVPGWASTLVPLLLLGGVQLLCLGVMGEYLAKMYVEIKARPRYLIAESVGLLGRES